jgi:DNA-binding response OmpR family regulator
MASLRILIVEDQVIAAMALEDALADLGHQVDGLARTASGGIELAEALKPDLIITDVNLGKSVDGIDMVAQIRKTQPVPVIFLTGHGDDSTRKRGQALGDVFFLLKPYTQDALASAIEAASLSMNDSGIP